MGMQLDFQQVSILLSSIKRKMFNTCTGRCSMFQYYLVLLKESYFLNVKIGHHCFNTT